MKLASCTFLLFLAGTTGANELATSNVRGLKTGGGSSEVSSGGMVKSGLKMKMMKAKKGENSGKKAGMNTMGKMGSMKAGGKMMGNGGMKAKKGAAPRALRARRKRHMSTLPRPFLEALRRLTSKQASMSRSSSPMLIFPVAAVD